MTDPDTINAPADPETVQLAALAVKIMTEHPEINSTVALRIAQEQMDEYPEMAVAG